jgi:hypothetical protein
MILRGSLYRESSPLQTQPSSQRLNSLEETLNKAEKLAPEKSPDKVDQTPKAVD